MTCNQTRSPWIVLLLGSVALAILSLASAAPARAQFDADDDEHAESAPAAAAPAAPARRGGAAIIRPQNPAVLAVTESNPQTPAELLRAIRILVDLHQTPLAKEYITQLTRSRLDNEAKAALVQKLNSANLMKLARHPEVAATLGPFIDDVFRGARAYRRDPARLTALADSLADEDLSVRGPAVQSLIAAGEASVAPLVRILADPSRADEQPFARRVILAMGDTAVAPLLGVLESNDTPLKVQVFELLGQIGAREAVASLLAPSVSGSPELQTAARRALIGIAGYAPNMQEAQRVLTQAIRRPLEQSRLQNESAGAPVELWQWNAEKAESVPQQFDSQGAALAKAVKLARDLYQLDPADVHHRRLYLLALLQEAKLRGGLEQPLARGPKTGHALASQHGAEMIEQVLVAAMAQRYFAAATGAAEVLGDLGQVGAVAGRGAQPAPLVAAAASTDPRLRFAAVEAIMKLNPREPFAGSSQVVDSLGFLAASHGQPRMLIVHPRVDMGQSLAGLARAVGYDADVATNGRAAFKLATTSPDYELILIHSTITNPAVDDLIPQLRNDPRVAPLAIGIMAPATDFDRIKRYALSIERSEGLLEPRTEEEMQVMSKIVSSRSPRAVVTPEEREVHALAALDWLILISARPNRVFDITPVEAQVTQALYDPQLSTRAATLLGQLGSPRVQRTLVELADTQTMPLATRQAAASAFAKSVARYGVMLTQPEILQQYDLYNANAGRDRTTHDVLASILNALEGKAPVAGM